MNEYQDEQLISMVSENDEDARDELYNKYSYIIDIIFNKYRRSAYILSVDLTELKQEAMVGFSDALVSYNGEHNASLKTFITLCVERRIQNYLRKADTLKHKALKDAYSLDLGITNDMSLKDVIGDSRLDPSKTLEERESLVNLKNKINDILSPGEKEVYELLINDYTYNDIASILERSPKQVDNTIQRIRSKIKEILK